MANRNPRKKNPERQKWQKLLSASVHIIKTQQAQLNSLVQQRKFLEQTIHLQNQTRSSELSLLKDHILQMKEKLAMQEMELKVAAAKADSLMGLTKTQNSLLKHKLENADSDLAAFREWFDILSQNMSGHEGTSVIDNDKGGGKRLKALVSEVKRLKCQNEKLSCEKKTEVSALLAEKKFVWNQYNIMEATFKEKLQEKSAELARATQKIQMISNSMKELQSSNSEKDNVLVGLKRDLAKLESDSLQKSEEISKLSKEVKLLKGSNRDFTSPLVPCTSRRGNNSTDVTVKKESQTNEKTRSSKRKKNQPISISDSPPKLFTSSFKVPKLKRVRTRSST